jgi:hypothetical protein
MDRDPGVAPERVHFLRRVAVVLQAQERRAGKIEHRPPVAEGDRAEPPAGAGRAAAPRDPDLRARAERVEPRAPVRHAHGVRAQITLVRRKALGGPAQMARHRSARRLQVDARCAVQPVGRVRLVAPVHRRRGERALEELLQLRRALQHQARTARRKLRVARREHDLVAQPLLGVDEQRFAAQRLAGPLREVERSRHAVRALPAQVVERPGARPVAVEEPGAGDVPPRLAVEPGVAPQDPLEAFDRPLRLAQVQRHDAELGERRNVRGVHRQRTLERRARVEVAPQVAVDLPQPRPQFGRGRDRDRALERRFGLLEPIQRLQRARAPGQRLGMIGDPLQRSGERALGLAPLPALQVREPQVHPRGRELRPVVDRQLQRLDRLLDATGAQVRQPEVALQPGVPGLEIGRTLERSERDGRLAALQREHPRELQRGHVLGMGLEGARQRGAGLLRSSLRVERERKSVRRRRIGGTARGRAFEHFPCRVQRPSCEMSQPHAEQCAVVLRLAREHGLGQRARLGRPPARAQGFRQLQRERRILRQQRVRPLEERHRNGNEPLPGKQPAAARHQRRVLRRRLRGALEMRARAVEVARLQRRLRLLHGALPRRPASHPVAQSREHQPNRAAA